MTKGHPSQGEHSSDLNIRPQKDGFISKILPRAASGPISLSGWWFTVTKLWSLQKLETCGMWGKRAAFLPKHNSWLYRVLDQRQSILQKHSTCTNLITKALGMLGVSPSSILSRTGWAQPRLDQPLALPPASLWTYPANSDLFHFISSRGAQWATGEPLQLWAMPPQQLPAAGQEEENRDVNS